MADIVYNSLVGTPNIQKILNDIADSAMTDKNIIGGFWLSGILTLTFVTALSGSDQTILDTIVTNSLNKFSYGASKDDDLSVVSPGQTTTTAGTYQEKLSLEFIDIPAGPYIIEWYFEYNGTGFNGKVELDDSSILANVTNDLDTANVLSCGGYVKRFLTAGTHIVDIDFKRDGILGTVMVRRARIKARRMV